MIEVRGASNRHGWCDLVGERHGTHQSVDFDEVILQTTPEIDNHIAILRKRFRAMTSVSTYVREQLSEFGTNFLLQSRAPVKGVIDLTS